MRFLFFPFIQYPVIVMEMEKERTLSTIKIFLFWFPLALMWIMMAVEQPVITAVIARLPFSKENLAVFGITFSIALLIESPVIQMLSTGTALVKGRQTYHRVLKFMHFLAISLTLLHILIAVTPLYSFIVGRIIGAPEDLLEPSRNAFLVMVPWAASIGYRRLWQGVLIRFGKTEVIPITMIIRLLVSATVLMFGFFTKLLSGAVLGALALSAGVIAGAVASYVFLNKIKKQFLTETENDEEKLSLKDFVSFYYPLALTSFIMLLVRPIITTGLARAPEPLASLAVWPVIHSFLFMFNSMAISSQEVIIALLHDRKSYYALRKFIYLLSAILGSLFLIVSLTLLSDVWFRNIVGLSEELLEYVHTPLLILFVVPVIVSFISLFRGIQIVHKRTGNISRAVALNCITLTILVFTIPQLLAIPGVVIASLSFLTALLAELTFLRWLGSGLEF